jgi:hypothetical protein
MHLVRSSFSSASQYVQLSWAHPPCVTISLYSSRYRPTLACITCLFHHLLISPSTRVRSTLYSLSSASVGFDDGPESASRSSFVDITAKPPACKPGGGGRRLFNSGGADISSSSSSSSNGRCHSQVLTGLVSTIQSVEKWKKMHAFPSFTPRGPVRSWPSSSLVSAALTGDHDWTGCHFPLVRLTT